MARRPKLDDTKPGFHSAGEPNLYLRVQPTKAGGLSRSWVMRLSTPDGKRRDVGLGPTSKVSHEDARQMARELNLRHHRGEDISGETPRAKRAALRKEHDAVAARAGQTFRDAADAYIKAHRAGWKNAKHAAQWDSTLDQHAHPTLGSKHVDEITRADVLAVLQPIWQRLPETASRVRARIESVLDYAAALGWRSEELKNPAAWQGGLKNLLPAPTKVRAVEHHAALPYAQMPDFMTVLRARTGGAARALEFVILTAARSGEVRGARWAEIDLEAGVWTVPAGRMKARREHRVPLSEPALALLRALPQGEANDLVFRAPGGGQFSDMALTMLLRGMDEQGIECARVKQARPRRQPPVAKEKAAVPESRAATAHGFRSTFRDWAAETTNYPNEMAEMALAHAVGNAVEAAYRRGDMFEKRRQMMADWATFCGSASLW